MLTLNVFFSDVLWKFMQQFFLQDKSFKKNESQKKENASEEIKITVLF